MSNNQAGTAVKGEPQDYARLHPHDSLPQTPIVSVSRNRVVQEEETNFFQRENMTVHSIIIIIIITSTIIITIIKPGARTGPRNGVLVFIRFHFLFVSPPTGLIPYPSLTHTDTPILSSITF